MLWRGKRLQFFFFPPRIGRGWVRFFFKKTVPAPKYTPADAWYTLAFLHNISTPLSLLASLIDEVLPSLQPPVAQTLHATIASLLEATHFHGISLSGHWETENININATTRRLLPLLRQMADPYPLFVVWPTEIIWTQGNQAAWEQILVNLVKNSQENLTKQALTPARAGIYLEFQKKGTHWQLIWSDSGTGIHQDTWEQIFQALPEGWIPQAHGFGMRSVRFWWEDAFQGELTLHRQKKWQVRLKAPFSPLLAPHPVY